MELTEDQKELLKRDEENRRTFQTFLEQVNKDYKSYFQKVGDKRDSIGWYFSLVTNSRPPAIRLRYIRQHDLSEEIKSKVINKYRDLFGESADYQVIES